MWTKRSRWIGERDARGNSFRARLAIRLRHGWQILPLVACVLGTAAQEPPPRLLLPTLTHVDQIRHLSHGNPAIMRVESMDSELQ